MVGESDPSKSERVLDKKEWHERANQIILKAQENHQPVSLFFIDINRFSRVNNKLGHTVGDKVIAEYRELVASVAAIEVRERSWEASPMEWTKLVGIAPIPEPIETTSGVYIATFGNQVMRPRRRDDASIVGHIGGDEITILAFTDSVGAESITQRLKSRFSEYLENPANEKLRALKLGMAVGSASYFPYEGRVFDPELSSKLYSQADMDMYQDKERQKNEQLPAASPENIQTMIGIDQLLRGMGVEDPEDYPDFYNKCFPRIAEQQ